MVIPKQPSLTCYNNPAKLAHSQKIRRVYRQAAKVMPEFTFRVYFNPGGIAVWGETYAKLYGRLANAYLANIEAYDTSMGLLVRQWDGEHSGANHYVNTTEEFINLVRTLAQKPFVRF